MCIVLNAISLKGFILGRLWSWDRDLCVQLSLTFRTGQKAHLDNWINDYFLPPLTRWLFTSPCHLVLWNAPLCCEKTGRLPTVAWNRGGVCIQPMPTVWLQVLSWRHSQTLSPLEMSYHSPWFHLAKLYGFKGPKRSRETVFKWHTLKCHLS